jgi:hypothetical protein
VKFRLGWVLGFDEVENLIRVVRPGSALGRFHNITHRLSSEFLCDERIVKNIRTPQELRLHSLDAWRGSSAVTYITRFGDNWAPAPILQMRWQKPGKPRGMCLLAR